MRVALDARRGNTTQQAMVLWRRMKSEGITVPRSTYNALLHAAQGAELENATTALLAEMASRNVSLNVVSYNVALNSLAGQGRPVVVTAMPVHLWRRLGRGYNQSEALARGALQGVRAAGVDVQFLALLKKTAHRKSQINFDPFQVYARTDIKEPSAPTTVNVTCYDTGQLYVSWSRPDKYHKSVDYYKIFYKSASDGVFDVITIESTEKNSSPNVSLKIYLVDFLFMINTGHLIAN